MSESQVSDVSSSKPAKSHRPASPKGCLIFLWVSGVLAILLFLTPTFYVIKYFAADNPGESASATKLDLTLLSAATGPAANAKALQIDRIAIDNSALLVLDLQKDPDPIWRARAARSLGQVLAIPYMNYTHPMEGLIAKSALSTAAVSDPDAQVKAAASDALQGVAKNGAVIER